MDYEVLVLFGDGHFEKIECATTTDVENTLVQVYRRAVSLRQSVMNLTVINKTRTPNYSI